MLALRAYRNSDAQTVASWLTDEQIFIWWSAGHMGEYPLEPQTLNAFYARGNALGEWFPKVMEEDEKPCAQMLMRWEDKAQGWMHFSFIVVDPHARGKGLGQAMLCMALEYAFHIKKAKRVTIHVFADNAPAIRLYERLGFSRIREFEIDACGRHMPAYTYEKRAANA